MVPTILSAFPFDIGAYAATVFQVMPWFLMKSSTFPAVKQVALSKTIVSGGPKGSMMASLTNLITVSELEDESGTATGHPVKCSTAMSRYVFPLSDFGNGPAKSIEKTENREMTGILKVVRYLGKGPVR